MIIKNARKLLKYIFIYIIYTLLVSCDSGNVLIDDYEECEYDCYLDTTAPSLTMDGNGYYHIEFSEGSSQTFSTLDAETGMGTIITKVYWTSDSGINYGDYWISSVNSAAYTDDEGVAHTVLSVWEEQVGDTLTVMSQYRGQCGIWFEDSIGIIVE